MTRSYRSRIGLTVLICLLPLSAQAKESSVSIPEQSRIFTLALTLRACDLRDQNYIEAVQSLKTITEVDAATAEVKSLSRETPKLRHAQSEGYAQAAKMLARMGAPPSLQTWAASAAARFKVPLVYDDEARKMAKTEPDAGQVMAELSELEGVKTSADDQQPDIAIWLKLSGGAVALWTADVGAYAADLRRAAALPGTSRLLGRAALRLLLKAPAGSPSGVRGDLSDLAPAGGGNLQDLSAVVPEATPRRKISRAYAKLLGDYDAQKQADALDKAE
ncbi:MAG: hypothetical protein M3Y13_06215 [Armatimonadota bacterium]|nr:hypothetical protein [Armatimonadota bacterium]